MIEVLLTAALLVVAVYVAAAVTVRIIAHLNGDS